MTTTRRIAHYEIKELLGEGGIGQVYAAYDTVLGRDVAIKSLRPELLNDNAFVERFRGEATSLARLNHPNITTLYALLPEGGNLYMVMELVRGRTLEAVISERGAPFTAAEAVAIIGQAADGLAYAHDMGVVHRDIKPANLIITDKGLLKIMDFGIARVQGAQRHTRDGSIIGTLAYMAPEQLRAEDVDGRTDLYSLAIVLYEMLTGAVPFTAASDYDLMRAQIHTAPERPTKVVPSIDAQVDKAVMRALSKKPGDRHASLAEFKEALGNSVSRTEAVSIAHKVTRLATAASLQPVLTSVSAIAAPARKFSPALRGVAIGAAAAVVVAGLVVLLLGPRSSSQTAAVPASSPPAASAPTQQTTAVPKSTPAASGSAHPMFPTTRQTSASPPVPPPGGPATTPARSDGNRPPFPVAAEPSVARSAAQVAEATAVQSAPVAMAAPATPAAPAAAPARVATATPPPETRTVTRSAAPQSDVAAAPADQPTAVTASSDRSAAVSPPLETAAATAVSDQPSGAVVVAQAQPDAGGDVSKPMEGTQQPVAEASAAPTGVAAVPAAPVPANVAAAPPTGGAPAGAKRVTYAEIKEAYDLKDYRLTRDLAEPMAASGDPDAQYIMARLHHIGGAMRKNEEKAVEWYKKAADQGHATAQYALGIMYENGDGVLADKRSAAEWYRKAATRGVAAAQFNLGILFARGEGVDKDVNQAKRWLTEASNSSNQAIADQAEAALEQLQGRRRRR